MKFLDLFEYAHKELEGPCIVYYGVRLLKDLEWSHGPDIEAVLDTRTGRLDLQEWILRNQVCNQKQVFLGLVDQ